MSTAPCVAGPAISNGRWYVIDVPAAPRRNASNASRHAMSASGLHAVRLVTVVGSRYAITLLHNVVAINGRAGACAACDHE